LLKKCSGLTGGKYVFALLALSLSATMLLSLTRLPNCDNPFRNRQPYAMKVARTVREGAGVYLSPISF
jgi:hypothetical protein